MAAATLPFTCPDGYLSGGEAFEQACSVLIPGYDELVRRIHEPLTVKFHHADELAPADVAEVVRGIAVRRIAAVTDADVGLCRDTFTAVDPDKEARWLAEVDTYNARRRSVERLMRDALADRMLTPYGREPTGEMERLVIDNPEVWRRVGLLPGLDSVPDDILSPGPDMAGKPFFLKLSELQDFLAALRHVLGGEQTSIVAEAGFFRFAGVETAAIGKLRRKPGPTPGNLKRYDELDRALFDDVKSLMENGLSLTAATQKLAGDGRVAGTGTATSESRAKRLARRYTTERPS
jgi:hypothetical protein